MIICDEANQFLVCLISANKAN